jgi:hypothetical protein
MNERKNDSCEDVGTTSAASTNTTSLSFEPNPEVREGLDIILNSSVDERILSNYEMELESELQDLKLELSARKEKLARVVEEGGALNIDKINSEVITLDKKDFSSDSEHVINESISSSSSSKMENLTENREKEDQYQQAPPISDVLSRSKGDATFLSFSSSNIMFQFSRVNHHFSVPCCQ